MDPVEDLADRSPFGLLRGPPGDFSQPQWDLQGREGLEYGLRIFGFRLLRGKAPEAVQDFLMNLRDAPQNHEAQDGIL
jgi:hypothetical protein